MEYSLAKKRLAQAQALWAEPFTSVEKFRQLREILYGVHLNLDDTLHVLDVRASELGRLIGGDFLATPFANMPDATEEEKRRKQLVAEFWDGLSRLKDQIAQTDADLDTSLSEKKKFAHRWHFPNLYQMFKGPIIFLVFFTAFFAVVLQFTSSQIWILNNGCPPVTSAIDIPAWIPGVSVPKEPIEDGGTGFARIPGLMYAVDGTFPGELTVRAYIFRLPINIEDYSDIQFDGWSLIGKVTSIPAFASGDHYVEFICNK